jgi:hypothetical protein
LAKTPLHKRVKFAKVFLTGKSDYWLRSTGLNTANMTWLEFVALISTRFAVETSLELIDTFQHMAQSRTLSEYIDTFEEIMGKLKIQNPSLSDEYFVGCFISGLKEHIKIPLHSQNPATLVQAYALARNYENYSPKRNQFDSQKMGFRYSSQYKQQAITTKNGKAEVKQNTASKWKKGKYFKCHEPWVPGHGKVCRLKNQVHLIPVEDDLGSDTEQAETPDIDQGHDNDSSPAL